MQLSCFRSVAQSAKQLPSDWEEPAPEVATNNRRHSGSTQEVHCTECTYREHTKGAVHTQREHGRCTAHTGSAQCTGRGPHGWKKRDLGAATLRRVELTLDMTHGSHSALAPEQHLFINLQRWIRWPFLVRHRFLAKRLLYPKL